MIPTGIGIITVFFVVSEFVPGGPLDQVETMIIEEANKAEMGGGGNNIAGKAYGSGIQIDPEMRMQIKRKLHLNHSTLERYMRMLVWFSPDSVISSKEIGRNQTRKVRVGTKKMLVYRSMDDAYRIYDNRYDVDGAPGELSFDQSSGLLVSTLDASVRFDPLTGVQVNGSEVLQPVPLDIRSETFKEYEYEPDGTKRRVLETRDEIYLKATTWQAITNWENWHGYFLLKFPYSVSKNKKCFELIRERLPISVRLGAISFFLTYSLCLLLGVAKAVRNGTRFDSVTSILVLVGYGIPGFVLAVFLIRMFGPGSDALVHLIPLRGLHSPAEIYDQLGFFGKLWDNIHHLIAPIICLTIGSFAGLTMLTKNSVLEEFDQLYAVAARARGLSERKVLLKHVLRNSLIPLVTGFPARFVMMFFAGSLLIEKVFSLDGIGLLGYTAMVERDFPLIMSNLFMFTYLGLICRLLSDIGYVIVDPRISFEKSDV